MKTILRRDWIILIILLAPFPFLAFTWDLFPESVPVHFNINGEPDNYAPKAVGLLGLPLVNIALYVFLQLIPSIDPKKKNFPLFEGGYRAIRAVVHILLVFIFFVISAYTLGYKFDMSLTVTYAMVLMILLLGNYMSSVRPNYFVGVRTPWTLANETVWKKTHRLTARLWVTASVIMLVTLPFVPSALIVLLCVIGLITIIPVVYSYIIFRNLGKTEHEIPKATD